MGFRPTVVGVDPVEDIRREDQIERAGWKRCLFKGGDLDVDMGVVGEEFLG